MRQGAVVWAARDASTPAVCHAQAFLRCGLAQVRRLRAVSVSSLARVGKQRRRRGRSASPARRSCRAWKPDGSSSLCLCVRRSGAAHGAALLGATRRLASGPLSCPGMPSDLKATGGGWGRTATRRKGACSRAKMGVSASSAGSTSALQTWMSHVLVAPSVARGARGLDVSSCRSRVAWLRGVGGAGGRGERGGGRRWSGEQGTKGRRSRV